MLLTGGAGFVASHLGERFLAEGDDVICMDNFLTGAPDHVAHLFADRRFSFIQQDVTTYIYVKGPLDAILHFASPASPVDYLELPIQTLKVGSLGTHKALGLAKEKSARFLLASTSEVYGDPLVHPQKEDYWGHVNPIGPRGVYDEAKRFAERDRLPPPAGGRPQGPPARHHQGAHAARLGAPGRARGRAPEDDRLLPTRGAQGMKILVTGGAGFIGSHVVDTYVAAGHEVIVVDDLSTGRRENLNPKARFHRLDITDPAVVELIRDARPAVLNLHAAQMDVRRSVADPLFDARVNILGTINLLEAARKANVRRVLFVSSGGAVYGGQEASPAPEAHPTNPVSPYGVSKRAGELYAFFYQAEYQLPFVALRYANVYGPRQDPHGEAGVVAIFTGRMLRDEPVVVNGDSRQTRDYVNVGDVARANLLALETHATGPFNIGTGVETDVNTLASLLLAAAGSR